jgi:hypothetical protein
VTRNRVLTALLFAGSGLAQTKLDLGAQARNVNFSNAASVIPFPTGASLPATCAQGQMFFNTAAAAGQNSYQCVAPNTWVPLGSGGNTQAITPMAIGLNSSTELAIGANCSLQSPCEFRIGSVVYSVAAPATVDVTAGGGLTYLYIDSAGLLTAGVAAAGTQALTCTGCQVLTAVTEFPASSIPLSVWNATNGTFDATGTDNRSTLATGPVISAGSNISITETPGSITISAVDASGLSGGSGGGTGGGSGGGVTVAGTGSELQFNNFGSLGAVTGSSVSGATALLGGTTPLSSSQSLFGLGNAVTGGNGNGTMFGINAPVGFGGDIVNWMSNNSSLFSVNRYGEVQFDGSGFLNSTQLRLVATGYSSNLWGNYGGAPGSSFRIAILSADATSQLQVGTGSSNNSLSLNGLGKIGIGTTAPVPSASASGPDVLIANATPATGSTLVQVQAGAGQSGDLMEWTSAAGLAGASISPEGALRNLPFGGQPACDATTRGTLWHTQGAAGVKDAVSVCAKDATEAYAWRVIF